jgi:hypothetical protein
MNLFDRQHPGRRAVDVDDGVVEHDRRELPRGRTWLTWSMFRFGWLPAFATPQRADVLRVGLQVTEHRQRRDGDRRPAAAVGDHLRDPRPLVVDRRRVGVVGPQRRRGRLVRARQTEVGVEGQPVLPDEGELAVGDDVTLRQLHPGAGRATFVSASS